MSGVSASFNVLKQYSNGGDLPPTVFNDFKTENDKNEVLISDFVSRNSEASGGVSFFDDKVVRRAPTLAPAILSNNFNNIGSCVDANICSITNRGTSKATTVQQRSPRRVRWKDTDGDGDLVEECTTTDKAMLDNLVGSNLILLEVT